VLLPYVGAGHRPISAKIRIDGRLYMI